VFKALEQLPLDNKTEVDQNMVAEVEAKIDTLVFGGSLKVPFEPSKVFQD
jgi:hypothetical protein